MLFAGPAGSLKRQQASQVAGSVAVTIAAIALIGWCAELPMLSNWGAGFAPTKPVTALCLMALGLALVHPGKNMRVAFAIGLSVAAIAAADLVLDLFGVGLGIDHRLVQRAAVPGPETALLVNITPVALTLAGGSLALSRFDRHHLATAAQGSLAGTMALFTVFGYLSGIYTLYGQASVNAPSLPTAVGLLCVVGAIFLRTGAMPALRKPRPLWHLQAMLGCAIIVPLLLYCAYAGFRIADTQLRHDLEVLTTEARILSANVDREIIAEIERLQALAASPSLRQGDFAEFQRQAEASLALRQSGNIMLIDRNMQQLVNTWVPFGTPLEKAAVSEPAQRALTTGEPQVTGLFMGPVVKQLLIGIIVPVLIEGETRYALVRSPNLHAFAGLVAAIQLPPGWHAVVSDATHRVIAQSEHEDAFIGNELPPSPRHRAGPAGVFEFVDSERRPSLQAYAWSELTGWQTAVWVPKALLQAPVRALWWGLGGIALMAFAIVVTLALWLGLIIARSIGHAARAAIASGADGSVLPRETPIAEVNALMAELRERTDLLRDSEHQLRLVTDLVPVGIARCDTEVRYKFINRYRAERLGLSPEQVIGMRMPEVIGDKVFAIVEPHVHECLAGNAVEFEVALPCQVEPQFMHCRFQPEWRDGKVVGLVAATTDVTSLKRAEAALSASEMTFRAMFDVSSVGHIEIEPQSGRFLRANAAVCGLLGYTEAELRALTVFDTTHPDDRDNARELLRRMIDGESAVSDLEKRCIRKDGSAVWARVTANVIRDASGRPLRNIAVIQNIDAGKRAEHALRASGERLQLALDAAQLGWWQYDPHHRMLRGDARSKEIFGVATDETPVEEIKRRVHPDDAEKLWVARAATLDPAEPKPYAIEFRLRRGDGEVRWLEAHWLAYFEGDRTERRTAMVIGTVADITSRKEREEKVNFLTREVNHRAKNILSVVQVIALQTAVTNPEDFIERFSERMRALSANQDLLVKNEWNGVEIADLVRTQLAHFAHLIGSRIAAQGPQLCLNPASAQTIGLAIHELSTNAGKYGALSTDKGRVDIFWGTAGDTLTISWTERDGPPVSPPRQRGFGTTVIEAMVEYNVDGTVDLDYAPFGVTWRLTCPAANVLER